MIRDGTTEAAIKIKWPSVTSATQYKVALEGTEVKGDIEATVTEFVFDATSLANIQGVYELIKK